MKFKRLICCFVFALSVANGFAQNEPSTPTGLDLSKLDEQQIKHVQLPKALYALIAGYQRNGDIQRLTWAMQRLVEMYPNSGENRLALAAIYAQQGKKTETYDLLLRTQQQGFGFDLENDKRFEKVAGTKVWKYVVTNLQANLKPFGEGKVAFALPKGDYLFESLTWDPKRQKLLVGSAREGKIYLVSKDGKLENFISPSSDNGLWSVYALAADPERDLLYVASTGSVYFKGFKQDDFGKTGVFKFQLSTGKLMDKYLLLADGQLRTLSSLTVGKDGRVFAADGIRNEIYKLDNDGLKLLIKNPLLTSIRGLAVSDDNKTLYFADYQMGLFGVDLAAGKAFDVTYDPKALVLGGIDGLSTYNGTLLAIESGMSPQRVIRITLSADGRRIDKMMGLDAGNSAFTLPTYGTVAGDEFYFIANSQKNNYGDYGTPKDDSKLEAVRIFKSNPRFAWNKSVIGAGLKELPIASPEQRKQMMSQPAKGADNKPSADKASDK